MSEKPGVDKIRGDIAAERQRLDDDLNALKSELRSLVPLAGAGSPWWLSWRFAKARGSVSGHCGGSFSPVPPAEL
jgi:hypothetical protein